MKTERSNTLPDGSSSSHEESPLQPLLKHAAASNNLSDAINGLVLGTFQGVDANGQAQVAISQFGFTRICAHALVEYTPSDIGRSVVLGFENGNPSRPIILGFIMKQTHTRATHEEPLPCVASRNPISVECEGKKVVIEAEQELELRCGESVVLLQADGRIQLRGHYITSHAQASQRIRGGSVQIN